MGTSVATSGGRWRTSQFPNVAEAVLSRFFLAEGRPPRTPYKALPMYKQSVSLARQQITMLSSFVEVWLAKEGHGRPVGMNLLTKVQMPNLPTLYGAMLAGVGYILMGAGIPREIPGVLDNLANHDAVSIKFDVEGLAAGEVEYLKFDPKDHWAPSDPAVPSPVPCHHIRKLAGDDPGAESQWARRRLCH
jgi:NAD(P)H-dependent flavin oxidoreductase YrpB (nitropropane dioxygenase family)